MTAKKTPQALPEKLLEGIPDPVLVVAGDGSVLFCNAAAKHLFGSDLVGKPVGIPLHDYAVVQIPHKDGVRKLELRVADTSEWHLDSKAVVLRDVTEREKLERGLKEKVFELDGLAELLRVTPIPVARVSMAGKVAWANENFTKTFGKVAFLSEIPVFASNPDKLASLLAPAPDHESGSLGTVVFEAGVASEIPMVVQAVPLVEGTGSSEHEYAVLINAVEASEEVLQAYMSLVFSDVALGLPNRRGLILQASADWADGSREQAAVVALSTTLDTLEQDAVMARVTAKVQEIWADIEPESEKALMPGHSLPMRIGRLNVNTLAIIFTIPRDSSVGASDLSFTMARRLTSEVVDSVTAGVVPDTRASTSLEVAIDEAGFAAQVAMEHDELVHTFQESFSDVLAERQNLTEAVRKAVENKTFGIVFQPRINLKTGKISSAEVLARCTDPVLGNIPPSKFIPVLRRLNRMTELTQIVGSAAMEAVSAWQKQGLREVKLSLNIVPSDLSSTRALSVLRSLARQFASAASLELEMAETDPFPIASHGSLKSLLRELGIELSLDDFGSGYSSFSYLISLPIACVKIDKQFVDNLLVPERKDAAVALIRSIIALARELHISVCAEGVETQEQLELLTLVGVDEIQGYIFDKPLEADAFAKKYLS